MKAVSFNDGWHFRHLGSEEPFTEVTVPHDAMLGEARTAQSGGGINTGWYEGYDYEYTKDFYVSDIMEGKCIIFEFEGVYRLAEVWINGSKAAFRPYGYTNFYVEAQSLLKYGEMNRMQVIARNSDQPNSRWYSGAGIYRPVTMWTGGQNHIHLNGVKIRTASVSPAVIEIHIRTEGEGFVRADIYDGGKHVTALTGSTKKAHGEAAAVLQAEIPDARLWSPEAPHLYICVASFEAEDHTVTDQQSAVFGLRSLSYGKEGICLNGKRVILRGACIHHDNGLLGACAYPEAEERKIRLLMENGYNAVRSAHNPCSKALLDACDRLGMLVMDEYVDAWYIHKTQYDYVTYFKDWWKQDLRDMVDKDYNHPSVIMYSTGNEVSETAQKEGIRLTGQMTEYLHSLDDRPVTCGINIFFNFLSSIGFGVYNDKKAGKEAREAGRRSGMGTGTRAEKNNKKKAVGSEFFNNLAGLLGAGTMKTGATLHGCDIRTRDAFAAMDVAGYNYGIYRYIHDLKKYPDRIILGSETFCEDAYRFWELAKQHPRIAGDFVWAGMDYLGEVGIGAWEYKDYAPRFDHGPGWISAGSGRIDLTGRPLAEAAYTRVAFELENAPVIAVRPVNHTKEKHSPSAWKMTNALESWSFPGCEGRLAQVEIYARASSVELLVNGRPAGRKNMKNKCRTMFEIPYEPGILTCIARDPAGNEISRSTLRSAGQETVLSARPETPAVKSGQLCFVRLKYTDREGILKPLERHRIRASVTGGRLAAFGNACPYQERGYLQEVTDTYYGEALAIIKAGTGASVTLCLSDGIRKENVQITIMKEEGADG